MTCDNKLKRRKIKLQLNTTTLDQVKSIASKENSKKYELDVLFLQ